MKFLVFQLLITMAFPIPRSQDFDKQISPSESLKKEVLRSLRLPHRFAMENLSQWGSGVYGPLRTLAFDEKIPMKTRWKSFMLYTQLKGEKSISVISRALDHKDWFMRSAALTALETINESMVRRKAFDKLNSDPALMVRSKALEILQKQSGREIVELFWKKLHSPDSFHNSKSLWIRKNLALNLMKRPRRRDLNRWVQLLHGSDEEIQQVAALALSKIDNQSSSSDKTKGKDVDFWKSRYPKGSKSIH